MIRNKILLICLLFLGNGWIFAQTPQIIEQLLQAPYMKGASFSLMVKDLEKGEIVYQYDPDRLLIPASILKTVTTATALELLGETYRYPTTLAYDGEVRNGVLSGNLYIIGSGDPSLGSSHFPERQSQFLSTWITALKEAGIHQIQGAVIADDHLFDTEGASVKWLREDMGNYYAAGSYGISVFDNLYRLSIQTGAVGSRPVLRGTSPQVPFLTFKNYLKVAAVSTDSAYILGAPLEGSRFLYGVLPPHRDQYVLKGDIPDPALFLAHYMTDKLQVSGIQVKGLPSCYRIEQEHGRWKEGGRTELITIYSPPLRELVRVCNHVSHNLYADALLKTIGLRYEGDQVELLSSFGRGIQVLKAFWRQRGLDVQSLRMDDGSGLAPTDRVTARFMTDLLAYMATQAITSDAFWSSLPRAGVEGSVRNFLKGTDLQGKARLKSGGITGVRCFVGYIEQDGRRYAVALLANQYEGRMSRMTHALGNLLNQLF